MGHQLTLPILLFAVVTAVITAPVTTAVIIALSSSQIVLLLGCLGLLLLLLSRCSRVRLCATPETEAHQAPPSLGFSSKNTGVGCHFLLQCMKVKSQSKVAQSCLTLRDPMDCSLPGSSIHGIFQARVLEWGTGSLFVSKNPTW